MKIIDAVLILVILGIGGGHYFQKNKPGSCYRGQIQLTEEVKTYIDEEFKKSQTRSQEIRGLKELIGRVAAAEKGLEEIEPLRAQNRAVFKAKMDSIRTVMFRKKAFDKEMTTFVETMTKQSVDSCMKGRVGNL